MAPGILLELNSSGKSRYRAPGLNDFSVAACGQDDHGSSLGWRLSMAFSSNFFLFAFMPAALALYFATPTQLRNLVLLAISLSFYFFDAGWLVWLLIFSILLNHAAAK